MSQMTISIQTRLCSRAPDCQTRMRSRRSSQHLLQQLCNHRHGHWRDQPLLEARTIVDRRRRTNSRTTGRISSMGCRIKDSSKGSVLPRKATTTRTGLNLSIKSPALIIIPTPTPMGVMAAAVARRTPVDPLIRQHSNLRTPLAREQE